MSGDVRRALELCRKAAEIAEEQQQQAPSTAASSSSTGEYKAFSQLWLGTAAAGLCRKAAEIAEKQQQASSTAASSSSGERKPWKKTYQSAGEIESLSVYTGSTLSSAPCRGLSACWWQAGRAPLCAG